jgi:putative transcriptional regulator
MEILNKQYNFTPHSGQLLISEPFLSDPNFRKTVILLCEHEFHGSVGFVLNRLLSKTTADIIPSLLDHEFPIFYGGPVEQNTLHFIHRCGSLIEDSFPIGKNVYWGGNIEVINELISKGKASIHDFKFFIGYSGWASGQLNIEIDQKAWWLTNLSEDLVFMDDLEEMWPQAVRNLGQDFAYLADSPEDYHWN